jgi:hypothetical protein
MLRRRLIDCCRKAWTGWPSWRRFWQAFRPVPGHEQERNVAGRERSRDVIDRMPAQASIEKRRIDVRAFDRFERFLGSPYGSHHFGAGASQRCRAQRELHPRRSESAFPQGWMRRTWRRRVHHSTKSHVPITVTTINLMLTSESRGTARVLKEKTFYVGACSSMDRPPTNAVTVRAFLIANPASLARL